MRPLRKSIPPRTCPRSMPPPNGSPRSFGDGAGLTSRYSRIACGANSGAFLDVLDVVALHSHVQRRPRASRGRPRGRDPALLDSPQHLFILQPNRAEFHLLLASARVERLLPALPEFNLLKLAPQVFQPLPLLSQRALLALARSISRSRSAVSLSRASSCSRSSRWSSRRLRATPAPAPKPKASPSSSSPSDKSDTSTPFLRPNPREGGRYPPCAPPAPGDGDASRKSSNDGNEELDRSTSSVSGERGLRPRRSSLLTAADLRFAAGRGAAGGGGGGRRAWTYSPSPYSSSAVGSGDESWAPGSGSGSGSSS
eukprot:31114-Pelagococcus_subviridis.AAC.9